MVESTFGKVEHFITSLDLPHDTATILLESEKDCVMFYESYYKRNKNVVDDLLDYREYKIEKSQKTLDLFLKECYNNNMRQAFQSTFYESFEDWQMELVEKAILNGTTSLEQLFSDFKKNPNKNILKNVL